MPCRQPREKESDMDEEHLKGAADQAKGSVKEAIGKVTGDATIEAEGAAQKSSGKVQKAVGAAKDKARTDLDDN